MNDDRNAVLEEAAKVADNHAPFTHPKVIAAAIRALTATPEPTDPAGVSEMADELERLYANYIKPGATTADAFALRSHMVAHFYEILAALRTPDPVLGVVKEALEGAQSWIEADDAPMGPKETAVHRHVLAKIEAALQTINEGERS